MTVHDTRLIEGSKGGGGGGGKGKGGGGNNENTLKSNARARVVELISEGPIVGLVNGAQSIYFEETPVQNENGTYNFKNVSWQERFGYPDQDHLNGYPLVETGHQVNVQVKKNVGPVVRTISETNADAVRVIIQIPALVQQNDDDGKLEKTSLAYRIDVRPFNGDWIFAHTEYIVDQKSTSATQRAHRVELPLNGAPWDIRVVRLTDDSDSDKLQNDLYFEAYFVIVEGKFTYPHSALVGLEVNAEDMGQNMPARSFRVKGRIIEIPSNYDPINRVYSGIWNGTFKLGWTNNPAWIFRDILVNDRYGLGEYIDEVTIDKWALYAIAHYCDQPVPSGFKDQYGNDAYEPRFTFNAALKSREEAYSILQSITRAWRGMGIWSLGRILPLSDMPADPKKVVTPANVFKGEFKYSSTALKSRHSVALVRFNDPKDFYRSAVEVVINDEMLEKFGWREKEVEYIGCTSRGLAYRYGKWILDVEQNETETVSYKASLDQMDVIPGDIIAIADPRKAEIRFGGRLKAATNSQLTLDRPFKPISGETYKVLCTLPSGALEEIPISSWINEVFDETGASIGYSDVALAGVLSQVPMVASMFVLTGTDVNPRLFRVISVREEAVNEFTVTALYHDPNKYARIERDIYLEDIPYRRPPAVTPAPQNLRVDEVNYLENGLPRSQVMISWSHYQSYLVREYSVSMVSPVSGRVYLGSTTGQSLDVRDLSPGDYTFEVVAIGLSSAPSEAAGISYTIAGWALSASPNVSNLENADNPGQTFFRTRDVRIQWVNNFPSSTSQIATGGSATTTTSPFYANNRVSIYNADSGALMRSVEVRAQSFRYTYEQNLQDAALHGTGPVRNLRFEVTLTDTLGRTSLPNMLTLSNPKAPAILPLVIPNGASIVVTIPTLSDPDIAGMKIWVTDTTVFTVDGLVPNYHGGITQWTYVAEPRTTYYVWVAIYDAFSDTDYVVSGPVAVTTTLVVDIDPPPVPNGLSLTTRTETQNGVISRLILIATIDPSIANDFAYFDYEIKQASGNYVAFSSSTPRHEWSVMPETTYTVKARAIDQLGNQSNYSATQSITTPVIPSLAHLINAGSVSISAGRIQIQGATMLSNWAKGGDATKIDGGALSANTIEANKLTIGQRGVTLEGVYFENNADGVYNRVRWGSGSITYVGDDGNIASLTIPGSYAQWTGGTLYIVYVKGTSYLYSTTNPVEAFLSDRMVIATYRGDTNLVTDYGRTIIDGSNIKTGTIRAQQIAVGGISADRLGVTDLSAISANLGSIIVGSAHIANLSVGTMKVASNAVTESFGASFGYSENNDLWGWTTYCSFIVSCPVDFALIIHENIPRLSTVYYFDQSTYTGYGTYRVLLNGAVWYPQFLNFMPAGTYTISYQHKRDQMTGGGGGNLIDAKTGPGFVSAIWLKR